MAKKQVQVERRKGKNLRDKRKVSSGARALDFPMTKKNLYILGIGIIVILFGFGLMATGITDEAAVPDGTWNNPFAVSIAPLVLLIGYCVIIPYGILKYYKDEGSGDSE